MATIEQILDFGPEFLLMLKNDGLDPKFNYKIPEDLPDNSKDFEEGQVTATYDVIDYDNPKLKVALRNGEKDPDIPLVRVEETAHNISQFGHYNPRIKKINSGTYFKFSELLENHLDRLHIARYSPLDMEYFRKTKEYWDDHNGMLECEEVPFYSYGSHIGAQKTRGVIRAYADNEGGIEVEIVETYGWSKDTQKWDNHSIALDAERIDKLNMLLEFDEVVEKLGLDLEDIVYKFNKLTKKKD